MVVDYLVRKRIRKHVNMGKDQATIIHEQVASVNQGWKEVADIIKKQRDDMRKEIIEIADLLDIEKCPMPTDGDLDSYFDNLCKQIKKRVVL